MGTVCISPPRWCFKRQLVDLVMEGVWQELLDSAQIEICVADWWGARENCGCIYRLRVRLLDVYENEVVKFSASPNPVLQWTERSCRQVGLDRLPATPGPLQLLSFCPPLSWQDIC
uniref:FBA domain-containing protein n=1 Tax=Castor canadensis TaxID=51338 RepID=A0A8C0VWX6_CASCN